MADKPFYRRGTRRHEPHCRDSIACDECAQPFPAGQVKQSRFGSYGKALARKRPLRPQASAFHRFPWDDGDGNQILNLSLHDGKSMFPI